MNDDELKKLWQQQPLREPTPAAAQLVYAMQKQTSQLRSILDKRDVGELSASAFVAIIFWGFAFFLHAHDPISRLGDWIVIASAIFIASKLIYTRRVTPSAPPGATIVESLRAELNSVRAQSRLLRSVLWWYLLPLFVGLLVMTWGGLPINDPVKLLVMIPTNTIVTCFFFGVGAYIYELNQQARAEQLLPLEAQLEALLHSAETGEPLDETHFADLRPIAISLTAAEESHRYSVAAQKIVELLNAGDFAAVQKLFDLEMGKALPPVKASKFFTKLAKGFGNIEKFDGPTLNGYLGWNAFRLQCQRGELTMSLVLDAEDKISGLYFKPTIRLAVMIKSLFHKLFRGQHVV